MFNPDRNTRNNIKKVGKGLKVIKAISNTLGTSPTETPDVDTKYEQAYELDENGVGRLKDSKTSKKKKPKAY